MLLLVAGLGMSALTIGLPGLPGLAGLPNRPVPAVAGSAATGAAATGAAATSAATTGAATTGVAAAGSAAAPAVAGGPDPAASVKRNLSPLIVVGHGAFAVTTMLLVLLAALGVGAG
jgi:hypothetical protein